MAGKEDHKEDNEDTKSSLTQDSPEDVQNIDTNINEEYEFLDLKLDELNTALDFLEQKNDDIHEKLKQLLQSNIDIREQLRNENNVTEKKE